MPEKQTIRRARRDRRQGKAPTTQAGEFVREEIHHVRSGKHGVRNPKQAVAVGLSKARRAGVKLPARGKASRSRAGRHRSTSKSRPSRQRSRATSRALRREGRRGASRSALSRQARSQARRRGAPRRSQAASKAARTRTRRSSRSARSRRTKR